jgi:DNA-binding beta-propeller fold protein YncE
MVTTISLATGVALTQTTEPTFVAKWGSQGSDVDKLQNPLGLATDSEDNVYVSDWGNHRIQKFDSSVSNGSFLANWGSRGSGEKQFNHPYGVATDSKATDSKGYVYVADQNNSRIQKFTSSGTYIDQWASQRAGDSQAQYPVGVATDSEGNVYVGEYGGNHRIQKFDSSGNFLLRWGSTGSGNGQFLYPVGVTTDSEDNVYVAEGTNHRIQKFDSSGNFLGTWGSQGSGDSQFQHPVGLATDSDNNVYVADQGNDRIQKFTSNGTFLGKWSGGSGDGQFNEPYGVATDSSDNVYVSEFANHRIQKFSQAPSCSNTPTPNDNGLVAYYPFSGNADDASGNDPPHNGTLEGDDNTFSTDVPSSGGCSSLSFDGINDAVSVPDHPALDFDASTPMTISLWAKKTSGPGGVYHILSKRGGCGAMNYQLARDGNGFAFASDPYPKTQVTTSVTDLPSNAWMHLAVTYDPTSSTLNIYADGQLVGSASSYQLGSSHNGPLKIGAADGCGAPFPGLLDEVRIYNRALSATDIGTLADKQTPSDTTKPTITVNSPTEGATYELGETITADYSCSDDTSSGSDLTCEGSVPNDSALDTSSVGPKTFTVTSTDKAGNTETKTVNYSTVYNFSGFFQPVDNTPTLNVVNAKAGSAAVQVRFGLGGDKGLNIFADGYPSSNTVTCPGSAPTDAIEQTVTPTADMGTLKYDTAANQYIYTWNTKSAWKGTCRELNVKLNDGTEHKALFQFKR